MKSIILLTVLFFVSFLAQAQASDDDGFLKTETNPATLVQVIKIKEVSGSTFETENTIELTRLYKNKNNRILKALKFSTKLNKAKLS